MEVGTLVGTNELAIPSRASDVSTERIFRFERPEAPPVPVAASAPMVARRTLVGLCLMTFAFGILLTWAAIRSRPIREARLQTPPIEEKTPQQTPSVPLPLPVVEPIVVAAAPPAFDWPPLHRGISKPIRDARPRAVRNIQRPRPQPADEAESPVTTSAPQTAPPAAKWVDPFAQ